jgi:hypothetical protein
MDNTTLTFLLVAGMTGSMSGALSAILVQVGQDKVLPKRFLLGGLLAIFLATLNWISDPRGKEGLRIFTDWSWGRWLLISIGVSLLTYWVLMMTIHYLEGKSKRTV